MTSKKEIFKFIFAAIFSLALLFPSFVQLAHTFEDHKHEVCIDFSVHIHKKQLDCSIYDFHFSLFNFEVDPPFKFAATNSFQTTETHYLLPEFTINAVHYFLRGPPLIS